MFTHLGVVDVTVLHAPVKRVFQLLYDAISLEPVALRALDILVDFSNLLAILVNEGLCVHEDTPYLLVELAHFGNVLVVVFVDDVHYL